MEGKGLISNRLIMRTAFGEPAVCDDGTWSWECRTEDGRKFTIVNEYNGEPFGDFVVYGEDSLHTDEAYRFVLEKRESAENDIQSMGLMRCAEMYDNTVNEIHEEFEKLIPHDGDTVLVVLEQLDSRYRFQVEELCECEWKVNTYVFGGLKNCGGTIRVIGFPVLSERWDDTDTSVPVEFDMDQLSTLYREFEILWPLLYYIQKCALVNNT